ncbi:DUF4932 domain-containing protein [Fusibacter ferrireducens]|uniref:DUF4932 domain-containing protein n=1 Tax=Fusibacter ferrireducens TaxID=2785058 RepID=A0ABR9ZNM0_9FIRM|nr:DUF4932 domain-containing protein [Fusibacter ferrireducens]MBF4692004.1 DUF4932 domain-containing protein [Fusibacter ferrireducens]
MKKKLITTLMILVLLLCTWGGLFAQVSSKSSADSKDYFKTIVDIQNKEQYSNGLSIRTSEILDTYIIASALNLEFDSHILLPDTDKTPLYKSAKKYFSAYSDHEFIQKCKPYIHGEDISGDAIGVILGYYGLDATEVVNQKVRLDRINTIYRQDHFKEDKAIIEFINGLESFYADTAAHEFFEKNSVLKNSLETYTIKKSKDEKALKLIHEMAAYIGVKKDNDFNYQVILTIFRPSMASFFTYTEGDEIQAISFQSPNSFDQNPYKFDYDTLLETLIHELLHVHINDTVKSIADQMADEGVALPKTLINSPMYKNMPLNRQLDEYLVRAIECRIYKQIYGEVYTFSHILEKEMNFGGFDQLLDVYESFSKYEVNRDRYDDIESFLPEVIHNIVENL